jgi:hypothetical protein
MHGRYDSYWRREARRRWRWLWITGNGPYAVVSRCPGGDTVTLWQSRQEADAALDRIDRWACGSQCRRAHHVVELEASAA